MEEIYNPPLSEVSRVLKKLILSFENLSGSELAKRSGIPVSTINRIIAGTVFDPKLSTLKPLADYFGISVDQLLGYSALPEKFDRFNQSLKPTMALPVFKLKNFESVSQKATKWFTWVSEKYAHNDTLAITIDTEEYEPIFVKDSILVVEPSMLPPQDDDYLAIVFENTNAISIRKYKIDGNDHYFVPLDPQFRAVICSETKYNILGVISETHTKLRRF